MRGHRTLILPGLLAAAGFTVLAAPTAAPWSRLGSNSLDTVRHLGGVVGWLALAWLGSRLFDLALRRAMASTREAVQYPRLLSDLVRVLLFGLALLAILIYVFEGAAVGFFATSSVLIAVVGFALRNIISDVFSGIALNFERPYRLGDWIEVAPGTVGRVTDIDWRATRLVTRDGVTVIVPNGLLAGGRLINYSYPQPAFRISLRIALDANVPVDRAKRALLAGALDAGRAFPDLRPDVILQEFGEAGPVYVVRFWISDFGQENSCRDAVAAGVLASLYRAGLSQAYPKQDVLMAREQRAPLQRRLGRDEVLARVDLFEAFEEGECRQLAAQMIERRYPSGSVVVEQGAPGDSLFLLAEGALEVSVVARDGVDSVLDRMVPGDIFGEVSLLTGRPRSASVTALTDVLLYEIRKEDVDPILRARPAVAERLAAILADRQRRNAERLASSPLTDERPPDSADLLHRLCNFFGLRLSA
jgi:small-conductance mechanosensitive channel/CRP-like cAMP-binding protein